MQLFGAAGFDLQLLGCWLCNQLAFAVAVQPLYHQSGVVVSAPLNTTYLRITNHLAQKGNWQ